MRVLVTRPLEDALPLAESLRANSIEPVMEPLLAIHPLPDATIDLNGVQAVLATSSNGVRVLAEITSRRDVPLFAVGNTTAETARTAGFEAVEPAGGDVDTLARLVRDRLDPEGGPLVHVTGTVTAGDLGAALEAAGFTYRRDEIYEAREAKRLSPEAVRMLRDGDVHGVAFFSPRTAGVFLSLARKDRLIRRCKSMAAFCLSPAVAKEAQSVPWKEAVTALHSDKDSLVEAVRDYGRRSGLLESAPDEGAEDDGNEKIWSPPDDVDDVDSVEIPKARKPLFGRNGPTADSDDSDADDERPAARAPNRARTASGAADVPLLHVPSAMYVAATVLLWMLLAFAVVGGVLYASRQFWMPYAEAYIQSFTAPEEEARLAGIVDRLAEVERLAKARKEDQAGLKVLEDERARFHQELERLMARVESLEGQFVSVKKTIDTASLASKTDEAKQTIRALSERLAMLEEKEAEPRNAEEINRLETESEKLSAAMADLTGRLDALEKRDVVSAATVRTLRKTVVVAEHLRTALRDGKPFAEELVALREAAPDKPVVAEAVALIEPYAAKGVPPLVDLRQRFDQVARNIKRASLASEGSGWWANVVERLSALMTIRRTDVTDEGGGIDAVLATAEKALSSGDLETAVGALEPLEGLAAAAAAPWLDDAKARIAAERAMVILHAHIVSATESVSE